MYQYNLANRFEDVASQHSDRVALWFSRDQQITYASLNKQANRVARLLLDRGAKKSGVVCISGEKSPGSVVPSTCHRSPMRGCPVQSSGE